MAKIIKTIYCPIGRSERHEIPYKDEKKAQEVFLEIKRIGKMCSSEDEIKKDDDVEFEVKSMYNTTNYVLQV